MANSQCESCSSDWKNSIYFHLRPDAPALLEYSTCSNFKNDANDLARQFRVTVPDVKRALFDLIAAEFLVQQGTKLHKKNRKLRIPTVRSRVAVNEKKLEEVKMLLERTLLEACAKLIEGDCQSVYQLQIQLFPLTSSSGD